MHKLLFDNNISHRILPKLDDAFEGSTHVMLENLDEATDIEVWEFANVNKYTIVTKDSDFNDLTIFRGFPPKVVWLRIGNCRVSDIESLINGKQGIIKNFILDDQNAILEIQ